VQTAAGAVSSGASLSSSDPWGAVIVAFRASGTTGAAPHITQLSPGSGSGGQMVTIAGTNFGGSQGTSTVTFNGMRATPSTWSGTSIAAPVPAGQPRECDGERFRMSSNGMMFTVNTTGSTDTAPPAVSVTAPSNGATVSGTVSVTANASDNVAVASVQFQLDGANVGALDTTAPYSSPGHYDRLQRLTYAQRHC